MFVFQTKQILVISHWFCAKDGIAIVLLITYFVRWSSCFLCRRGFLSTSSYEPGNRDEFCGVLIWVISARSTAMNSRNTTKMVEHKFVLFATVIALWTLVTLFKKLFRTLLKWKHIQDQNSAILVRAKLFCLKCFIPATGLECSYGKIFISVTGSARPLMNTSIFLQRKECRGEISETEPARLTGLMWRGP